MNYKESDINEKIDKIVSGSTSDIEFFSDTDSEYADTIIRYTKKDIEKEIKILINNYWQDPKDLPESHAVLISYKRLSLCYSLMDDEGKKMIKNIVAKQHRPSDIKDGTVGAFIFGCINNDYDNIDMNCSIHCANSIGYGSCNKQLWVQKGKFPHRYVRSNNPPNKDEAYIYVDEYFVGFSREEISDFKRARVKNATVLVTKNGKHFTRIPKTEIRSLPLIDDTENVNIDNATIINPYANLESEIIEPDIPRSRTNLYIIIIVFIAVILIAIVFLNKVNYSDKKDGGSAVNRDKA